MTEETQVNLLEHIYDNSTMVEIPGTMLYAMLTLLNQVKDNETIPNAFISQYPEKSKKVFNKEDKNFLEKVEVDWGTYPTAQSFFEQTPVEAMSLLGAMATDQLMLLQQAHLDNINNGLTKKVGSFEKKEDVKLS